jgi:lysophospholipase L1-like esterase
MRKSQRTNHTKRNRIQARNFALSIVLLCLVTLVVAQTVTYRVHIIGDSTVCNYAENKYPWAGWGQVFGLFFKSGTVTINNAAIGGRSTKSFYVEGRWTTLLGEIKSGDFVLIQFGHNDRDYSKEERYADTTLYKSYLLKYVTESRAKGAIPVFVTPMNMNTWNGTALREVFTERDKGADYRGAMINVANELKVPLIDLEKKSAAFMKTVGQAYCTSFQFMGLDAGEYPNYPDGNADGTHFQEMGALVNARMVAEGIKELSSHADVGKLAAVLAPLYQVTVQTNKANTGLVTVSGSFPAGATVTVKVKPNTSETFQNWADATGKSISTSKLSSFKMGTTPVTYNAMFKGGGAVAVKCNLSGMKKDISTVQIGVNNRILQITAPERILSIDLYTINGKHVLTVTPDVSSVNVNCTSLGSAVYRIIMRTEHGTIYKNITM